MMRNESAEAASASTEDAAVDGVYYFLDVGGQKYGECILAVFGDVRILIDGSHVADFEGQQGYLSVPDQLREVLGTPAPHDITLLVVTHCHADHVGCLPELVANGIIRPRWALVTDPKLGFGRTASDDTDARVLQSDPGHRLAAALREEDASDLTDDELQRFMDVAATVEWRYANLQDELRAIGTKVVPYHGDPLPGALVALLRPSGLKVLGPTEAQLLHCAQQIETTNKDAQDAAARLLSGDAALGDVGLYREVVREEHSDAIRNARGNGMNCQSITLALGKAGARALLAGDMQFTEPGVAGADDEVTMLLAAVAAAGPYRLFKTTHHTSHNGQDDALLDELGSPPLIVHSGGLRDPSHPYPDTLQILKRRRASIRFARTDRNGLITVTPHLADSEAIATSRGRLNDFTDNVRDVTSIGAAAPGSGVPAIAAGTRLQSPQIVVVNLPVGPVNLSVAGVDIVVRPGSAQPEFTVSKPDAERRLHSTPSRRTPDQVVRLASGRDLPRLLFVTDRGALEHNIGVVEARVALAAVAAAGQPLCEIDGKAADGVAAVRAALRSNAGIAGVVILGGYDAVPSAVVDVLGSRLRDTLGAVADEDSDDFIVWSDEAFGDVDGDRVGELPVSRIPDGRDSSLFLAALQADRVPAPSRFGIRNVARPFAEAIWPKLAGDRALEVSETFLSSQVTGTDTSSSCHYFMLHGDDRDARVFTGELENGSGYPRAFEVGNVPRTFRGLVFTGCCWGALTVSQKASEVGGPLAPRVPERSIALSYLKAGANAFVGCTGSHYSGPDVDPQLNFAAELHAAFWTRLPQNGFRAAPSLFAARKEYSELIARRGARQEPLSLARRLKNRAQFTCLGLGW